MNDSKHMKYHYFVDNKKFDTDHPTMTGQAIKAQAAVDPTYQLFLEVQGDAPDRAISDGESVDLNNPPKHFYAVPPATFGCK